MNRHSNSVVFTALSELKQIKKVLLEQAKSRELAELLAAKQAAKSAQSARLFMDTVGKVTPIKHHNTVDRFNILPKPIARQRLLDESKVMQDSLSDAFGIEQLLDTDTNLSYRVPGISNEILKKLRRGDWTVQGQLDLHGFRIDGARQALTKFIHYAISQEWRCIKIIHGKGLGSKDRQPILKSKVRSWLVQTKAVQCFVTAHASQGGAGAVIVLLSNR